MKTEEGRTCAHSAYIACTAKPFENVSPPKSLFQRGKKSAISSRVIEWRMEITLSDKNDRPTCVGKKG